jgi:hypothetical protein
MNLLSRLSPLRWIDGDAVTAGDTHSYVLSRLSPLKYKFGRSLIWRLKTSDNPPVFNHAPCSKHQPNFYCRLSLCKRKIFLIVRGAKANIYLSNEPDCPFKILSKQLNPMSQHWDVFWPTITRALRFQQMVRSLSGNISRNALASGSTTLTVC